MKINKIHYKQLSKSKKIYIDASAVEIREKLNIAFMKPTAEDDMTGIYGKYSKTEKLYKVKYIFTRNRQLQPQTFNRYYYLVDIGSDANGSYIEYTLVYDNLFEPLIRGAYIAAVLAVLAYLLYSYKVGAMDVFSALTLGVVVSASSIIVFKKSKETKEECEKTENLLGKLISDINFC